MHKKKDNYTELPGEDGLEIDLKENQFEGVSDETLLEMIAQSEDPFPTAEQYEELKRRGMLRKCPKVSDGKYAEQLGTRLGRALMERVRKDLLTELMGPENVLKD